MSFSEDYLRRMVRGEVVGDFPPFTLGSITKTENYIRKLLARLEAIPTFLVEADFASYGSGFASYVEVKISQRDGSDSVTLAQGKRVTQEYDGLMLYISRLTPYWFYGGSKWSATYEGGRHLSGGSMFLTPDSPASITNARWQRDSQIVETVLQAFRYSLLTPTELRQPAPAGLVIPTVLADEPYSLFNCFFYWQD